jgi:hypothetical protein
MKLLTKLHYLFIFLLILSFFSCVKDKEFPIVPHVKFQDFKQWKNSSGNGDSAWFIFTFTDGDGDIGLGKADTLAPFDTSSVHYYNFFMDYFEKQNGNWIQVEPAIPFSYRIPRLEPQGRRKVLEGEVIVRIPFEYYDFTSPFDTIMYSAYIYDRALNKSNVIETPPFVVKK